MKDTIDFIGIGCQKCGTTSVFNALAMHPLIIPPSQGITGRRASAKALEEKWIPKECHYWGRDVRTFGTSTYHSNYWGELQTNLVYGEFTPNYIIFKEALEKIHHYNPQIKLIAIFRNPVERLWSEYQMIISSGRRNISFREFIDKYADLKTPKVRQQYKSRIWPLYRSCYGRQVKRLVDLFDRKNLLLLRMEELKTFSVTIEKIFLFLGVEPIFVPDLKLNSRNCKKAEILYFNELLDRFFLKEIEMLEELTGWDCSNWKKQ